MKTWGVRMPVLTVALSAVLPLTAGATDSARVRPLPDHSGPLTGMQGLWVDPSGSMGQVLRQPTRNPNDSRLDMVSAVCTNCGSGCPPLSRTVQVVLQAIAPVAAGYGVSNLTSSNWTVVDVSQSTSAALAVGQQVTITITGDLLSCSSWFSVWFSICGVAPLHATDRCWTFTLLHSFTLGVGGRYPHYSDMAISGSRLFGATNYGDTLYLEYGVLFSIGTDGSGYGVVHTFTGAIYDGARPEGGVTLSGSRLYGTTSQGGTANNGVVYSIGTDGSAFVVLHRFLGGGDDGRTPRGNVTISGSVLYGVTQAGGDSDLGVVYSSGTDGSAYALLHEFIGGVGDGAKPLDSPALYGSTLFGTAMQGGDWDQGVIYRVGTDGSNFGLLHEFARGVDDGGRPSARLLLLGSTLYGTAQGGGDSNCGVVYSIGTDGSAFTLLHEFAGGVGDGCYPEGGLSVSGSTLYGTTNAGGDSNQGVIYSIQTDGTAFTLLHEFLGGGSDGSGPWYGALTIAGPALFGTTCGGGSGSVGVVFKLE